MNEAIRRQALQTTAKIALSLTVFACGGTVEVGDQTSSATDEPPEPDAPDTVYEDEEDEPPIQAYLPDVPEEEALVCQAPPAGEEVSILDADQLACCVDQLEPVWPAEGPDAWDEWQVTMQDEGVGACCNVVIAHADQGSEALFEDLGWSNLQLCCQAAGGPFGPTCTPWGPPVPPAMRAFDSLDALEIA